MSSWTKLLLCLMAVVCLSSAVFASRFDGEESSAGDSALLQAEQQVELMQEQVAMAEAQEETRLQMQSDDAMQAEEEVARLAKESPADVLLEQTALAPESAETSVVSEEQFGEETPSFLSESASERIDAELAEQVAAQEAAAIRDEESEHALLEEQLQAEMESDSASETVVDTEGEAELAAEMAADADADAEDVETARVLQAKRSADALQNEESYPVMIESAAQTAPLAAVNDAMKGASERLAAAVQGAKGMLGKLKHNIGRSIARKHNDRHAAVHRPASFIAAHSSAKHRSHAKGGDQWWLEKAPWFLPPPPEWGPMPVTMYTSYFHKPTSPHHLDYAHGIPLPQAEALNLARRTYPQPPFEAQAEASFMEVAAESHPAVEFTQAELVDDLEESLTASAESDEEALLEIASEGASSSSNNAAAHTEQASASSAAAAAEQQIDRHPNFFLDESADKLGPKSEAVEAVEVDNLAQASPVAAEDDVYFSMHM